MTPAGTDPGAGEADREGDAHTRPLPLELLRLTRPGQWVKNVAVFAALIFSRNLLSVGPAFRVVLLFACFTLLAGAVYIFNDWVDAPSDRRAPSKASRPLAAGTVSPAVALGTAAALTVLGGGGALALDLLTGALCLGYVAVNVAYSLALKREPILDVGCIAAGFALRIFAGATVIDVSVSRWLVLCTIFLSLFLGFTKRRQELVQLGDSASDHRSVLAEYTTDFVDQMNGILAAATVVCYTLYTVDGETVERFGTQALVFTVPVVLYGVFRFLYLIHLRGLGSAPAEVFLRDRPLLTTVVLWGATVCSIIYLT